jgi:hypothetical protein
VYSDTDLVDYNTPPITDIPLFGGSTALAPPSKPVVTDDPDLAQFVVSSTVDPNNYPVNRVEFYVSTTSTGDFYTLSVSISNFNPGDTIDIPVSYYGFINGDYYFKTRVGSGNLLSDYSPVSDVFVFDNGNIVSGGGVGSAVNAVYTENILINNVIPLQPPYYLALTEGKDGAYYPLDADDGLLWDADNNQLSIGGGIHLTPLAAQPAVYSTGTIAVANRTGWDPVGITTGTAYPVFYNGQIWTQMGGKAVQAQYQSTATQVINTTTNGYKMTLDTVDFQYGITQNNGTITLSGPGIYNLQWSGQFQNSNSSIHDAYVWLRQNGVDVPGSNGILTLPGKHAGIDGSIIAGWNYFIQTTSTSETVELYWGVEVSAITLVNLGPQSSPTRPGTASLIVTVFKVSS